MINDTRDEADALVLDKLFEGVNAAVGGSLTQKVFENPDSDGTHITQSSKVGPTIAGDIKKSSLYATIFALLLFSFTSLQGLTNGNTVWEPLLLFSMMFFLFKYILSIS